jgi:hypothetical protein
MAYYGPQYHSYGAMPERIEAGLGDFHKKPALGKRMFLPKFRSRTHIATVCTCLTFPVVLFTLVYADVNFVQYDYPVLCYAIIALSVLPCLAIGALAATRVKDMMDGSASSAWLMFLAVSSFVAVVSGALLGQLNYNNDMYPYYNMQQLNEYRDVNPMTMRGKQLMDAGRISFVANATIDFWKAQSFQNYDTYCVAPVSIRNSTTGAIVPLQNYDFWVVGLNCCPANATSPVDYRCGAYANASAHDGLRVMSERQRAFYKLAAQQSEAAHRINSRYPVFFHWVSNADAELVSYSGYGMFYFVVGVAFYFVVQLLALLLMSFGITHHGL